MDAREMMLAEYETEMARTRPFLERVPMDRLDFEVFPGAMKLGSLAALVARLAAFTGMVVRLQELDFNATDPGQWRTPETTEELLRIFDEGVAASRSALAEVSDEALHEPWTLRSGDTVYFREPRWAAHELYTLNHLVHHRAQLGVYLRALGLPHPAVYGPSAHEH
ncbi:MAG TPA: DinB family protein [Longimicrobiales bacterium]